MAGKDTSTIVLFDVDGTLTVPRKVRACEQPAFQNLPASCAASASGRTAGTTFLVVSGGKALVSGIAPIVCEVPRWAGASPATRAVHGLGRGHQ